MPYADPAAKKLHDKEYGKRYRAARDYSQYQKDWRKRHPGKASEYTAKWKYGITPEEYRLLFAAQAGRCALCREVETTKDVQGRVRDRLSIDHQHGTNTIRGLLCHHCNAALGHAKDSPSLLRTMAAYLEGGTSC